MPWSQHSAAMLTQVLVLLLIIIAISTDELQQGQQLCHIVSLLSFLFFASPVEGGHCSPAPFCSLIRVLSTDFYLYLFNSP